MIKSISVSNYLGDILHIDLRRPETSGLLVQSISGLGPVKANINTTDVVTNDGSMFNSARLTQRNIVIQFIFIDDGGKENIEDLRQKTYKYFPVKKQITLYVRTENRYVRTIGYVESNEPNIFSKQEGTQISVVCPDSYFYSVSEGDDGISYFNSIESMFEFPFSNDSIELELIQFGWIHHNTENVITYKGDAEIGVRIYIHAIGPASNIRIHNTKTREKMHIDTGKIEALTGAGIGSSDDLIISTVKGEKGIQLLRGGKTYNILNCLDKDVDWFSLAKGDNIFAFTADSGSENLQFRIENNVVYEGV